jgi:hypothetical protein
LSAPSTAAPESAPAPTAAAERGKAAEGAEVTAETHAEGAEESVQEAAQGPAVSIADLMAAELASMVSVIQPTVADVRSGPGHSCTCNCRALPYQEPLVCRDKLDPEADSQRQREIASLATLLTDALAEKQPSVLSSAIIR